MRRHYATAALIAVILTAIPAASFAQAPAPAPAASSTSQDDASRSWIVLGATSTTFRGTCQFCDIKGDYLDTLGVLADIGYHVNRKMDVGAEVLWVSGAGEANDLVRTTFVEAVAQFHPWHAGFFVKGGAGMAFVRNWVIDLNDPTTQKALSVHIGAGWEFALSKRFGMEVFGAQHAAALGDFVLPEATVQDVMGNYWSFGAAIVIR
jgi:hypothetical protein